MSFISIIGRFNEVGGTDLVASVKLHAFEEGRQVARSCLAILL